MTYPTREEFEAWLRAKPKEFFKTKTVCADCLRPMDEREIILRAIATVPFQTEVIFFTYVCGTSRMSAECIDALVYISSGFFDPDKWDFSPETIEAAIKCIMDGDPERRRQQGPARCDRLDWRAISSFQHMPADYRRKMAYFFRGNEKIIDFIPYRHTRSSKALHRQSVALHNAAKATASRVRHGDSVAASCVTTSRQSIARRRKGIARQRWALRSKTLHSKHSCGKAIFSPAWARRSKAGQHKAAV